jgi:hypothetical protein
MAHRVAGWPCTVALGIWPNPFWTRGEEHIPHMFHNMRWTNLHDRRCLRIRSSPTGTARVVRCSGHPSGHYISTSRPTSTTWAGGTPKYAAGRLALRCIMANRDFLQTAMPDASLPGITITRLK